MSFSYNKKKTFPLRWCLKKKKLQPKILRRVNKIYIYQLGIKNTEK